LKDPALKQTERDIDSRMSFANIPKKNPGRYFEQFVKVLQPSKEGQNMALSPAMQPGAQGSCRSGHSWESIGGSQQSDSRQQEASRQQDANRQQEANRQQDANLPGWARNQPAWRAVAN